MTRLRPAEPADAAMLGAVHVRAWRAAYRGLLPDEYLDGLSAADRANHWREALCSEPRPSALRVVSEDESGCVVAFLAAGRSAIAGVGEVYVLNVDPAAWGCGHGSSLLGCAVQHLAQEGFGRAVLWVHPGNTRARRFYEAAGWVADGATQTSEVFGVQVPEVRYLRAIPDAAERLTGRL